MSRKSAEWLLAGVIFARSTSLLFAKVGLESMSPLNLLAVRFCLAFAVLCVIFWKKLRTTTKTDLLHGMILGAVFFAVMTCETFALTRTHASTVSFLVNTAIVIVPLFEAALHRKAPDHRTLLCAAVSIAFSFTSSSTGAAFSFARSSASFAPLNSSLMLPPPPEIRQSVFPPPL